MLALLAPSGSATDSADDVALRGVVIPTGFQSHKYQAMIQVAVDGSPLPNATWDLEASFAASGGRPQEFSGHVVAGEPGAPVVFEVQVEFAPGPYVLALAATETSAGQSQTTQLDGRWPDPDRAQATISPVILLQPAEGAFVRGADARARGALAIGADDPLAIQLPTAVVSVVCRGTGTAGTVRVERELEGASSVEFAPIELREGNEPCAQLRDLIRPGTLGHGFFRYRVSMKAGGAEIASSVREFRAGAEAGSGRPGS